MDHRVILQTEMYFLGLTFLILPLLGLLSRWLSRGVSLGELLFEQLGWTMVGWDCNLDFSGGEWSMMKRCYAARLAY